VAQLAGIGGGGPSPLGTVRNALGLDELSIGGGNGGTGLAPTVNAGRYVAPGVYVGASQSASGQGTSANVEINIFKGLKLKSSVSTGGNSASGNGESIGLSYQFNY
jgi:translocation and assembly module TamB